MQGDVLSIDLESVSGGNAYVRGTIYLIQVYTEIYV